MADEIQAKLGCRVEERQVSIHELINSDKEDRLISMFGVSTHCPLLPVERLCYRDTTMMLNMDASRAFNESLDQILVDVMSTANGERDWITPME